MTILQYDAGSRGALAYLDAARELNGRSDRVAALDGAGASESSASGTEEMR